MSGMQRYELLHNVPAGTVMSEYDRGDYVLYADAAAMAAASAAREAELLEALKSARDQIVCDAENYAPSFMHGLDAILAKYTKEKGA